MKYLASFIILFSGVQLASAQSLQRTVVSTAGGFNAASIMSLEYTIGEVVVGDVKTSSVRLNQGYNQVVVDSQAVSVSSLKSSTEIMIFPNPASTTLSVQTKVELNVVIIDMTGKIVGESKLLESGLNEISVSHLAAGVYYLQIKDEGHNQSVLKWVKR